MRGKKAWLPAAALVVVALLLLGIWYVNRPQGQAGDKTITVEVVHADESSQEFTYQTSEEFLGPVLIEEGLAQGEESTYGLFITTVDGETVDDSKQEWWNLAQDGVSCTTGVDATEIADGDAFELILTVGY